jgi:hypothetical protein
LNNRINKQQFSEWTENPVTVLIKESLQKERDDMAQSRGLDAFNPFEPNKTQTQEILANLNGYVDAMDVVISIMEGDLSSIEEEEE